MNVFVNGLNNTGVLSVISVVIALVSIILVFVAIRQNSKMIEASTRPYIVVY